MKKRSEATQTLRAGCSKADPQTNKHTHTNTDRGDYNTLRSLARSVKINRYIRCKNNAPLCGLVAFLGAITFLNET